MTEKIMKKKADEKLRAWLRRQGLKQTQFARALGVGHMTVWYWLHGTDPHEAYLRLIREKYPDCPILSRRNAFVTPAQ